MARRSRAAASGWPLVWGIPGAQVALPAVTAALVAQGSGSDTATISSASGPAPIPITGALAAQGSSPDTASIAGSPGAARVVAALGAQSTTTDTASMAGTVVPTVTGDFAAQGSGPDTAAITGSVLQAQDGALAATDAGPDTAAMSGVIGSGVQSALAATETGADTAAMAGTVDAIPQGALAATEVGSDTAAMTGAVVPSVTAALDAQESTSDTASMSGAVVPTVQGAMAATEMAGDTATISGTAIPATQGAMSVQEVGADTATMSASVAPGEDADAASYLNAQTTAPSAAERSRVDTLVKGLKSDGDWAGFDWIVLIAAETAQAARLNLRNPAKSMSAINLPSFTANRGYQGDGASSYLDFNEVWNASGNQYALNSAAIGVWCNLEGSSGFKPQFGSAGSTQRALISATNTTGNDIVLINSSSATVLQQNTGSRKGHRAASRTGASVLGGFYNGSKVVSASASSVSISPNNMALLRNNAGYVDDRFALAYSGAGMSDAAMTRIHNRFNTYLTAKGAA